jgi:arsenite methyltransferase
LEEKDIKKAVREGYARVAESGCDCRPETRSCCGSTSAEVARGIGYSEDELATAPEGSNLGLGCGNPVALASLKPGEAVLDLGSGAGFDCFLAADRVGGEGRVIGVDMTPEMLGRARANAEKAGRDNVEFRLGEIEHLPVADGSVDAVISNCVINLSPDKKAVFEDAFRVLKPGGRLMVSDTALLEELPDGVRDSVSAYVGCVGGAVKKEEYLQIIRSAGFVDVQVKEERAFRFEFEPGDGTVASIAKDEPVETDDLSRARNVVVSVSVWATRPSIDCGCCH